MRRPAAPACPETPVPATGRSLAYLIYLPESVKATGIAPVRIYLTLTSPKLPEDLHSRLASPLDPSLSSSMTDPAHSAANNDSEMKIDPTRAKTLNENLSSILTRIASASSPSHPPTRLVAVSKLKPANDILALHAPPHSHLHFGENYQQELLSKSLLLPREIRWHFIGALQTNKCKPLAEQIPNLWCVESVDTVKKADQLEKGRRALCESEEGKGYERVLLRVFVQVNTSGEEGKSGVEPGEAAGLCRHVREQCPRLKLQGVMTIGAIARSRAAGEGAENEDFVKLREVRDGVAGELGIPVQELELSMGMSDDFESAVRCGSNEVRVGSTIFGERPAKKDAQIKEAVQDRKG